MYMRLENHKLGINCNDHSVLIALFMYIMLLLPVKAHNYKITNIRSFR